MVAFPLLLVVRVAREVATTVSLPTLVVDQTNLLCCSRSSVRLLDKVHFEYKYARSARTCLACSSSSSSVLIYLYGGGLDRSLPTHGPSGVITKNSCEQHIRPDFLMI